MCAVRLATAADVPRVAQTLAAAFADYPWTDWTVAADDRERRLRELYALFARLALAEGELWVADDGVAAAAWLPPERSGHVPADGGDLPPDLGDRLAALAGDRAAAGQEADAVVAARRPAAPHWYLASLGTAPAHRGRGLGAAVVAPVLARADDESVGAATETSLARNLGFYARLGFDVTDELVIPGGGPPVWLLWRDPRPAASP